jgi:CRP/FNR family transcriptional regulator
VTDTAVLRGVSIFGGLAPPAIEFLGARLERVHAGAGEAFFHEGELGDSVYVLADGRAEVVRRATEGRSSSPCSTPARASARSP